MAFCHPPKLPSETQHEYSKRCMIARAAWRQQKLDRYSRRKSRLLSPDSDDANKEDLTQTLLLVGEDILIELGQASREDFIRQPRQEEPPARVYAGKTLSEISGSLEERSEFSDEWLDDRKPQRQRESPLPRSKTPEIPANKRKRGWHEGPDEQAAQPDTRRRIITKDTHTSRTASQSGRKRKRGSDHEAARETSSDPAAKRKRVKSDLEEKPAPVQPASLASSSSSLITARVTRARRRQLSGLNARLLQLGQRGQLSLQEEQAPEAQAQEQAQEQAQAEAHAPKAATDRSKGPPASTKTPPRVKAKATTAINTRSKARSVKTRAGDSIGATRIESLYDDVYLQSWTRGAARRHWVVVQKNGSMIRPVAGRSADAHLRSVRERERVFSRAKASAEDSVKATTAGLAATSLWMERTRWGITYNGAGRVVSSFRRGCVRRALCRPRMS
ncbi:hypothetical protein M406DRAFT_349692 [Cryphonectria parasitica EP155]|uniref:Uncharacterized protein n=1 Tax=Cryphonectria parasitica (strain ATCC 38755 / EP155) TaxID=660469 RepID=A0A9P5CR47_CRYP1|nr:uncharacterized protein M406DRAFT_349692 [Cryphonectria parasitica EP155]KAF3768184.1 hypothetical protein M406DRAFT_349692 [Cryphonectria parasitica EP155]